MRVGPEPMVVAVIVRPAGLAAVEEAIRLKSDFAEAWYNLGLVHGLRDEPRKAIEASPFTKGVRQAMNEFFGDIRPATTMVEVSRLIDPDMLVEIEADAIVATADSALDLILQASLIVQFVMALLVGASVVSWAIILRKRKLVGAERLAYRGKSRTAEYDGNVRVRQAEGWLQAPRLVTTLAETGGGLREVEARHEIRNHDHVVAVQRADPRFAAGDSEGAAKIMSGYGADAVFFSPSVSP